MQFDRSDTMRGIFVPKQDAQRSSFASFDDKLPSVPQPLPKFGTLYASCKWEGKSVFDGLNASAEAGLSARASGNTALKA